MLVLILTLAAGTALAAIPKTMSYQGMLRDYDNNIVPDGDYSVVFRIYDVETEGAAIWGEPDTVSVTDGVFSAVMGELYSMEGLPFDKQYWLSIEVESTGELSPRIKLTPAPYARMAGSLELPFSESAATSYNAFTIVNTTGAAIWGTSTDDRAVTGMSTNSDGVYGVGGTAGVSGSSPAIGVAGFNSTTNHIGNLGGNGYGVFGRDQTTGAYGMFGYGTNGVFGSSAVPGYAGQFSGRVRVTENLTVGGTADMAGFKLTTSPVTGYVLTSDGSGVGTWQASGAGTLTLPYSGSISSVPPAFAVTNTNPAVVTAIEGISQYGYGIYGKSTGNVGVLAEGAIYGLFADTDSSQAVHGYAKANNTFGFLANPDYGAYGMHGVSGDYGALGTADYGVFGYAAPPDYAAYFDGKAKTSGDLEVGNLARIEGTTWPTSGKSMELAYSSSLGKGYIQVYDRDTGTWGDLYLGGGKVGIGTAYPARALDVSDVMRLEPRSSYPSSPSDGDLCVVGASGSRHIYCYLNGAWKQLD
jgi:hypothetical protein